MSADKAVANFELLWSLKGGDTGRGRVEHRSFEQLRSTLNLLKQVMNDILGLRQHVILHS